MTFDGNLVLGDSGTGTGTLSIDPTSTLFGGGADSAVIPFTAGQAATVINAGRIDLTNGDASTADSFRVQGGYVGDAGLLLLHTELGDDGSASDKLVIDGGTASGETAMRIVSSGGGALTVLDGILVVEAANGGTTAAGAFALDGRVAAGAYEYFLFRSGVSAGSEENWYLRSAFVAVPAAPGAVPVAAEVAVPVVAGMELSIAGATPVVAEVVPLYRTEVPAYGVVPPVAHHLALSTLGTFHERRGEQALLNDADGLPTVWGRVFGQDADLKWDGTVAPSFDGTLFGFQAGADLFGREGATGHHDRAGLFLGHARMDGDIRGQALGWNDLRVGSADIDGTSLGAYWTHVGPNGWYLDGILMGTWFGGHAASSAGESIGIDGMGVTASVEGGYPVALTPEWTLEPQAQLIWQHLSLDDQADRLSTVSFASGNAVTGRLGVRLQGDFQAGAATLKPYLKANLWHTFDGEDRIHFAGTPIVTGFGGTALEIGGGVVAKLSESASLFATAGYTFDIGGETQRVLQGNIGLSVKW